MGNYIKVGAGAVVCKLYKTDGLVLAGIPAKIVKRDNIYLDNENKHQDD